jgi:serpin B
MRRNRLLLASVLFVSACVATPSVSPGPTASPTGTPSPPATPSASPTLAPTPTVPPSPTPSSMVGTLELARSDLARATVNPDRASAAADAIDAFGLDLYRRLAGGKGNIVLSPASVAIALSMARLGARGQTATEMDAVLHDLGAKELADAANALDAALALRTGTFPDSGGVDQNIVLRITNGQFVQFDMPLQAAFLDAMATRYGAGAWKVDYATDPEAARQAINAWVAENTEDRIPEILAPGVVTAAWRLAIANAIYLKAAWLQPFAVEATASGQFTRLDGSVIRVPMMHALKDAAYAKGNGWAAVELPYVGHELAMLVIVPNDLASFDAAFDAAVLRTIVDSLQPSRVDLTLPKFDFESRYDLSDVLAALGMPTAFSGTADFSGIMTAQALRIAKVIHQANITVDEAGTEAAAATVIGFDTAGGSTPPTLKVNRPFLFAIRDVPTGAVVFMGRVVDPSATR